MRFLSFDCLDSTSTHAQRLLESGAPDIPFAVWAKEQTHGRGRMGRSWLSPQGGLYLTLVLGEQQISDSAKARLPLAVALGVSIWLRKKFGIRVTIKWPNDILFGAAKLCGILCEGRIQGEQWGPALVGIGINVLGCAPSVPEQSTTSVESILAKPLEISVDDLARDLAESLAQQLLQDFVPSDYQFYSLEHGQTWINQKGDLARMLALSERGNLVLQAFGSEDSKEIQSIHHDWTWLYQAPDVRRALLLADLGNSRCKLAYFADALDVHAEPQVLSLNLHQSWDELCREFEQFVRPLNLPKTWPLNVISVQPYDEASLASLAVKFGLRVCFVPKRPVRVDFSAYDTQQLGIDRMALIEGGCAAFPGQNIILLSAGTALTVEVVTAEAVYWGGYILSGLQTRLDSLAEKTSKLPRLKIAEQTDLEALLSEQLLGADTESAMLRGSLREIAWFVEGLKRDLTRLDPSRQWQVCVSGGYGDLLSRILDVPCQPSLILKGVRLFVLGGLPTEESSLAKS